MMPCTPSCRGSASGRHARRTRCRPRAADRLSRWLRRSGRPRCEVENAVGDGEAAAWELPWPRAVSPITALGEEVSHSSSWPRQPGRRRQRRASRRSGTTHMARYLVECPQPRGLAHRRRTRFPASPARRSPARHSDCRTAVRAPPTAVNSTFAARYCGPGTLAHKRRRFRARPRTTQRGSCAMPYADTVATFDPGRRTDPYAVWTLFAGDLRPSLRRRLPPSWTGPRRRGRGPVVPDDVSPIAASAGCGRRRPRSDAARPVRASRTLAAADVPDVQAGPARRLARTRWKPAMRRAGP